MTKTALAGLAVVLTIAVGVCPAADWPRFRGPDGSGVSGETGLPLTWSDSENLKWKTALPGPGSSSPIVSGDRIFVTCYSGYGVDADSPGNPADLVRHLLCVDRKSGKVLWSKSVKTEAAEDAFRGYITEHGYASSTPVTDGERVYAFFSKAGMFAYDMAGKQLWKVGLGTQSNTKRWGSGASPILYKNTVIVNAADESRSIRALDRATGKEVWKAEGSSLDQTFDTPLLVDTPGGGQDLVVVAPLEVWGMNPDTGKLRWYAEITLDGNITPSVVAKDGVVYVYGGFRRPGSLAVRAGGKGDVTKTHVLWTSSLSTYVPSVVLCGEHVYWVSDRGLARCVAAKTGETVYREQLAGDVGSQSRAFYASVVLADGKLYAVSRRGGTFVLAAKPQFKQLARNRFASDASDFNGSPAVSDGQIFLRSNRFLYCIQAKDAQ